MIPASDLWMLGLRPLRGAAAFAAPRPAAVRRPAMATVFPEAPRRRREHLAVGVACSLPRASAQRLLAAFREARPGVDLVLHDLPETDLADQFARGGIDVAIAPDRAAEAGWKTLPLAREQLVAALPDTSPLARAAVVTPQDLRHETLLLAGDETGHQAFHRAVAAALGGSPAAVAYHPVERDTLLDLVAMGVGITLCPSSLAGAAHPGVCFRPIVGDAAEIGYSLMWPAGAPNPPRDLFVALAEDLAKAATHGQA
jgi:DNA-binding transcriptional LysR family regulator